MKIFDLFMWLVLYFLGIIVIPCIWLATLIFFIIILAAGVLAYLMFLVLGPIFAIIESINK